MRTVFHPYLPNGPAGDPALWIDLPDEGRSLLLDLGDLRRIANRKLLRVERVVVTHAHMDHFIGFDQLLRLRLGSDRELVVTGPPGFIGHVRGRLDGYAWNLIESYPLRLVAEEVDGETVRASAFNGAGGLRSEPLPERPFTGVLHAERAFTVHGALFDHGIPVLGVTLHESEHLSVNKDRLRALGLVPGAWLSELKQAVRRCRPDDEPLQVQAPDGSTRQFSVGELAGDLLFRTPGQRIAYFADMRATEENRRRAVELAGGVDLMICEAAFLHADESLASERNHLTARQAGELARDAGAGKLAPFHFSPRYQGREQELVEEAREAFGGPVVELPRGPVFPESGML